MQPTVSYSTERLWLVNQVRALKGKVKNVKKKLYKYMYI